MANEEDSTSSYRIKDIGFFGSGRRVLLQSANGPCPLLAICNVLLLRNQLSISPDARYISFNELVEMVSGHLFDANARASSGEGAADVRENLESSLEILPRLNVGLDVNCKFASPTDFEYTREMAIFDLLDICLFHGWVVSQQDQRAHKVFAHLSYNQVVERLIAMQDVQSRREAASAMPAGSNTDGVREGSEGAQGAVTGSHSARASDRGEALDEEAQKVLEEGLIVQDFLDRTASQLSYDGLLALHGAVRERQLAVFFRNSHFNTLLKYQGDLYLLCTDIAFAHSHIVWEKLDEVDGDTSYCDANFRVNDPATDESAALAAALSAQATLSNRDHLFALQLMQEDLQAQEAAALVQQPQDHQLQLDTAVQAAGRGGRQPPVVDKKKCGRVCCVQ